MATVLQVAPTPFSSKLVIHYIQEFGSGRFCEYDYGPDRNMKLYGTRKPPDYNLTNVITPIAILVGQEDLNAHRLVICFTLYISLIQFSHCKRKVNQIGLNGL